MLIPFFQILKRNTYKSVNTLFILIILKETIYIKTIIQTILIKTIIQIDKHKVKYIITVCIPIIIINFFLLFIKKIYNYIKKISSPHNYKKKNLSAKYKNGKPGAKFIIK